MSDAHIPTKEELLSEGSSLEQKLLSEIQAARRLRIKWYDIRRSQLNPFAERQEVSRKGIHQYQHDMLIRLTPESQLDDACRYGAAGLSKDHARVSRSIVLTRGLSGLLGTVSLA